MFISQEVSFLDKHISAVQCDDKQYPLLESIWWPET
jgi:hypothetical protein